MASTAIGRRAMVRKYVEYESAPAAWWSGTTVLTNQSGTVVASLIPRPCCDPQISVGGSVVRARREGLFGKRYRLRSRRGIWSAEHHSGLRRWRIEAPSGSGRLEATSWLADHYDLHIGKQCVRMRRYRMFGPHYRFRGPSSILTPSLALFMLWLTTDCKRSRHGHASAAPAACP